MADTTFVSKVTHILATWLNDVNKATYRAIGTGTNGVAPSTPADVRTNIGLTAAGGAALVGNDPAGGSVGATVQAALDLKANTSSLFTDPRHRNNTWDDAATPGNAMQSLTYDVTNGSISGDRGGWSAIVEEVGVIKSVPFVVGSRYIIVTVGTTNFVAIGAAANIVGTVFTSTGTGSGTGTAQAATPDNFVALIGHSLHLGAWDGGAYWGIATEAWSNASGDATLIGGELSVISQSPVGSTPKVGMNAVFKNRPDVATHPTAPVIDGPLYNFDSFALFSSSQARPSGAGAAWSGVGSGWQTVLKVGDPGFGSGLDWEGGSNYPGSSTYKAYSTVLDLTNALTDLAGSNPWHTLYKNSATYWGMRFNGMLTGQLETKNLIVNVGGAGYAIGDIGTINGGTGSGAQYFVQNTAAGVVTEISIRGTTGAGGSGYTPASGLATTATVGVGAGLTVDLAVATGYFYGANVGIAAGGAGYAVNDVLKLAGGTAGTTLPLFRVVTVAAGVVTAIEFQTNELLALGSSNSLSHSNGNGFTVGVFATTTSGAGAGCTLAVTKVFNDFVIGGERYEYWRMTNPSNPTGTGQRQEFEDASFPGNTGIGITTVTAATGSAAGSGHVIANRAGAIVLTLPAPSNGRAITVRTIQNQKVDSAAANVVPLVGGAAGVAIVPNTAGKWALLVGDGTNWQIQSSN